MSEIFPVKDIQLPLGEVVANAGLKQLRIAETEKYPVPPPPPAPQSSCLTNSEACCVLPSSFAQL